MNVFYRLLNALIGSRRVSSCSSIYTDSSYGGGETGITIDDGADVYFGYALGLQRDDEYHIPLPDTNSTVIGPEIITDLRLTTDRHVNSIPLQDIQFGLANCPHLEKLRIDCFTSHFKLIAEPVLYDPKPIINQSAFTTTQNTLTKIQLDGSTLTQDLVDLLSIYLPNLQVLICSPRITSRGRAIFIEEDVNIDHDHRDDITLNLTELHNLDNFTFDIANAVVGEFDHLFIHFKYYNSEEKEDYYYISFSNRKYRCAPTALDFWKQCQENNSLTIKSITFICNKIDEFILCSYIFSKISNMVIAEFYMGQTQPTHSKLKYPPIH